MPLCLVIWWKASLDVYIEVYLKGCFTHCFCLSALVIKRKWKIMSNCFLFCFSIGLFYKWEVCSCEEGGRRLNKSSCVLRPYTNQRVSIDPSYVKTEELDVITCPVLMHWRCVQMMRIVSDLCSGRLIFSKTHSDDPWEQSSSSNLLWVVFQFKITLTWQAWLIHCLFFLLSVGFSAVVAWCMIELRVCIESYNSTLKEKIWNAFSCMYNWTFVWLN